MPQMEPFKGVLYNPDKVDISKVVAPPYDVIPPKMQDELYKESEHNIVRLILGKGEPSDSKENNKYKRAKQFFNNWLESRVLIQDKAPAIYVYSQEYIHECKKKIGLGFMARMKIEDPKTSRVLPHEYTFAKPKEDRLNLIREVNANLSPIFTLFQDEDNKISEILRGLLGKKSDIDVEKDGVRHRLWRLTDNSLIKKIQESMSDKDIFIADGHHRYEVATIYREEMRGKEGRGTRDEGREKENGYDYVMMYFSPMSEETLTILATHRLIKGIKIDVDDSLRKLKTYFEINALKTEKELFKKMSSVKNNECALGVFFTDRPFYLLKLKKDADLDSVIKENKSKEWKRLDVSILHGIIFDNMLGLKERVSNEEVVVYTRDPDYAINEVNNGTCSAAFFLNPTKISQVKDIAKIGDKMPHKSTYFYPKLLSGLVINKLDEEKS